LLTDNGIVPDRLLEPTAKNGKSTKLPMDDGNVPFRAFKRRSREFKAVSDPIHCGMVFVKELE
jgi:hypothetical protein